MDIKQELIVNPEAAVILGYHNGLETREDAIKAAEILGWDTLRLADFERAGLIR